MYGWIEKHMVDKCVYTVSVIDDKIGISSKTGIAVGILKFFERSDFRNFKAHFSDELKEIFPGARKIETGGGNALYFAGKR
jgi:hypothetical protein